MYIKLSIKKNLKIRRKKSKMLFGKFLNCVGRYPSNIGKCLYKLDFWMVPNQSTLEKQKM